MNSSANVHGVKGIKVSTVGPLFSNLLKGQKQSYAVEITAIGESGDQFTLTLFADQSSTLDGLRFDPRKSEVDSIINAEIPTLAEAEETI